MVARLRLLLQDRNPQAASKLSRHPGAGDAPANDNHIICFDFHVDGDFAIKSCFVPL
jgi:hypothetical protein